MDMKTEYTEKLKAQLNVWSAEIDYLEAKIKQSEVGMRAKLEDALADIKKDRTQAESKLQQMLDASDDAWEELKAGGDAAWERIKIALAKAKSSFTNH